MSYNNGPKIVTSGLLMYLDAANRRSIVSGSTVWTDLTNNKFTGSLINGPTFNSLNAGSVILDGTDDYIFLNSFKTRVYDLNGPFTLMCSVQSDTASFEAQTMFSTYNSTLNDGTWLQLNTNNTLRFVYRNLGTSIIDITQTSTINYGSIYNLSLTYNGSLAYMYVNGVLQSVSGSTSGYFAQAFNDLLIGSFVTPADGFASKRYLKGKFYQFCLYNRALSAAEIRQNYDASKGRFGL